MTKLSVQQILGGKAPADQAVTVKGWVRTRRDSKAGISFVNLSDGSCFHPVQVVAPATLPNIAVAHDGLGKPVLQYAPLLAAYLNERGLIAHLSISDEVDYAVAFVVVERS